MTEEERLLVATNANMDRGAIEKRLARVNAELQAIEKKGAQNWQWSRQYYDLHNEKVKLENELGRPSS